MGNRNSGRRPKPTALKVLQGNPGQRKLNEAEPKPPVGEVVPPAATSKAALVIWERLAPVAKAMGTLTTADVWAFKTLCELQASMDMASRAKDAEEFAPFTVSDDYNGAPKMGLHGALGLELKYAPVIRPYYEKFGLEPVGRARISVPKSAQPADDWAALGIA